MARLMTLTAEAPQNGGCVGRWRTECSRSAFAAEVPVGPVFREVHEAPREQDAALDSTTDHVLSISHSQGQS